MELTDEEIELFIEGWRKDFGETLSPERARSEAVRLLNFFSTLEELLISDPRADLPGDEDTLL